MQGRLPSPQLLFERLAGWLALGLLLTYTYGLFFAIPYPGFYWSTPDNLIQEVFVGGPIQVGDELVEVDTAEPTNDDSDSQPMLFSGIQPGETVPLVIERDGHTIGLQWIYPGPTPAEIWNRLSNQWWLAFVFWATGQFAVLFLRPKDARWRVFVAFNFLTAIWLSASSVSRTHFGFSQPVLRSAIWLTLPVYCHLHWLLPRPLGRLPDIIPPIAYLLACLLAVLEWFRLLPANAYQFALLLALVSSLVLLSLHLLLRTGERRELLPLVSAALIAFGLPLILSIAAVLSTSFQAFVVTLLALPVLPAAYLFTAFRRELGNLELRANRAIGFYLFFLAVVVALVVGISALHAWLDLTQGSELIGIAAGLLTSGLTAVGLQPFQRWVERQVLGVPLPQPQLMETHANKIANSLDEPTLVQLVRDEILPSLLVRQSALLLLDYETISVIYADPVAVDPCPDWSEASLLINEAGRYRPAATGGISEHLSWIRLPLVLAVDRRPIGLWLLGRRDPDDLYDRQVVQFLQSLANQTAVALAHITQAKRLRLLYQVDTERHEQQRAHLARELHDNFLHQLAQIETSVDEATAPPHFYELMETLVSNTRQAISELRPPLLDYGLFRALEALANDLNGRNGSDVMTALGAIDEVRYEPHVELHIYRIVQQLCENALKHAAPGTVMIRGSLSPDLIDLTIDDDGSGFPEGITLNLTHLVARKHFGLAGLLERAIIIGAKVQIDSVVGRGTQVQVQWSPKA